MLMHAYTTLMQVESAHFDIKPASVLLHDELEEVNAPCYFHEFMERAQHYELQYVAEAHFPYVMLGTLPAEVAQKIGGMATSLIELEQYIDFARNRTFRQTLLCHQDVTVDRRMTQERVTSLYVSSMVQVAEPDEDERAPGVEKFITTDGMSCVTGDDVQKAAFHHLIDHAPQIFSFSELVNAARERAYREELPNNPLEEDISTLAALMLESYSRSLDLINLYTYRPRFVTVVSERPVMSAVARAQAERGRVVTNMRHENVELDKTGVFLAPYLDGIHDRATLLEKMAAGAVFPEGVQPPPNFHELIAKERDTTLEWLARMALLVE
jgi:methyltransferase-like protein